MKKIKVKLVFEGQSKGRGVGFYGEALKNGLSRLPDIELTDRNPDIVHYTYFNLFSMDLPAVFERRVVITIHDLTPLVLPGLYPVGVKGKIGHLYQRWRAHNASAIVTDSLNSRADINKIFGIDMHKLFVTPLASRDIFFTEPTVDMMKKTKKRLSLPDRFVLTVAGGPNPNKNLVRLALACAENNTTLVIVGKGVGADPSKVKKHPELREFFELVKMKNVLRVGFLSDEELHCLYRLTDLYCQASLYEGFGLPLLEAMATKTLVVSSNKSSLPEIYDPVTPNFDPYDLVQMSGAIRTCLMLPHHQKEMIIKKNYKRSKEFSFEMMTSNTLSSYKYSLLR